MKNPNSFENQNRVQNRKIVVLAHNIRSTHNIGAILRTSEGFGVSKIIFSGYSPFPILKDENFQKTGRLPHIAQKIDSQIHKTALGAEAYLNLAATDNIIQILEDYHAEGFQLVGLENNFNDPRLIQINSPNFQKQIGQKIVLILGEEVEGISDELKALCDRFVEIPMVGRKESFNVSVATGMILYELKCYNIENRS